MMTKVTVKVCGDCHELRYNAERNRMEGITLLGPSDVRRLLEALAEAYGKGKSKRAKAISEGASQLASLIDQEVSWKRLFRKETPSILPIPKT